MLSEVTVLTEVISYNLGTFKTVAVLWRSCWHLIVWSTYWLYLVSTVTWDFPHASTPTLPPPLFRFVFLFGLNFLLSVAQDWCMNHFRVNEFVLFRSLLLNLMLCLISYQEHVKAHLPVPRVMWLWWYVLAISSKQTFFGHSSVLGWTFIWAKNWGANYWILWQDMEYYNKLEDPADEENDMLDLAFGLTETLVPFARTCNENFSLPSI